jgi:hypothetical protein
MWRGVTRQPRNNRRSFGGTQTILISDRADEHHGRPAPFDEQMATAAVKRSGQNS